MSSQVLTNLILCNLVWSVHPIFGKWLLEEFSPFQVVWLRYSSAFLAYLIFVFGLRLVQPEKAKSRPYFVFPSHLRGFFFIFFLGSVTFCFTPLLQTVGLSMSMASENAILVALEPLLTLFLAWIFLKEKITQHIFLSFGLACVGVFFLTGFAHPSVLSKQTWSQHFFGNLWMLLSLLGEATYSVLGKKLTRDYPPRELFGTALFFGLLCLSIAAVFFADFSELTQFRHFSWKLGIAWLGLGPLGTAGAYLYFIMILKETSVSSLVFLLFLQPLAGAAWGYLLMGDRLSALQTAGGMLILLSVLLPQGVFFKKRSIR